MILFRSVERGALIGSCVALFWLLGLSKVAAQCRLTDDHRYFREVSIVNQMAQDLYDVPVRLVFDTGTPINALKMKADGSDIVFVNEDTCCQEVPFWVEDSGDHIIEDSLTHIWIKVGYLPASDTVRFNMFYGNPAHTSIQNISAVFDSVGNPCTNPVASYDGNITVNSGELEFNGNVSTIKWRFYSADSGNIRLKTTAGFSTFPPPNGSYPVVGEAPAQPAPLLSLYPGENGYIEELTVQPGYTAGWFTGSSSVQIAVGNPAATGRAAAGDKSSGVLNIVMDTLEPCVTVWYRDVLPNDPASMIGPEVDLDTFAVATVPDQDTISCTGAVVLQSAFPQFNYQWYKDSLPILGATDSFYTAITAGKYYMGSGPSSCAQAFSDEIEVSFAPRPQITSISPDSSCDLDILHSATVSFSSGTVVGWQWILESDTINTPTAVHNYSRADSHKITLMATGNNGCVGIAEKWIDIFPNPEAGFLASHTCEPDLMSFADTSSVLDTVFGTSIVGHSWDFGDGGTDSVPNPVHDYLPGTFSAQLAVVTDRGCTDTTSSLVQDFPKPAALFSFANQCEPQFEINFGQGTILNPDPFSESFIYDWNFGDPGSGPLDSSASASPAHTFSTTGAYQVELIVATSQGDCRDTSYSTVELYPKPAIDSLTPNSACEPDSIHFASFSNVDTLLGSSIVTWDWSFGDGNSGGGDSVVHGYANPGQYFPQLVVATNHNCRDTLQEQFNFYPKPQAGFDVQHACEVDSIRIVNSAGIASVAPFLPQLSYSYDFGDGNSDSAVEPGHLYASPGPYQVTQVVTSAHGCSDTLARTANYLPAPVAGFSWSAVCEPDSMAFVNLSTIDTISPFGTGLSHLWHFGDGDSSSLQHPVHHYAGSGVYLVTLTTTSDSGCVGVFQDTVVVNPKPSASFATGNECDEDTAAFSNTSTNYSGAVMWAWDFGDGTTSSDSSTVHVFSSAGTYNVTLVATTSAGCRDTAAQVVEIFPKPIALFSAENVCDQDTVSFQSASTVTSGAITQENWDFGDGTGTSGSNPLHLYPGPGMYPVTNTVLTNQGCVDSITLPVRVHYEPVAAFIGGNICQADSLQFLSSATTAGDSIILHHWTFGDGDSSFLPNPYHSYAGIGSYSVSYTVTTDSGCVDSDTSVVAVYEKPTADFSVQDVCQSDSSRFVDGSIAGSDSLVSWLWTFDDGDSSMQVSPTHLYAAAGVYEAALVVQTSSGCSDTLVLTHTVFDLPVADLGNDTLYCEEDMAILDPGQGFSSYLWSDNSSAATLVTADTGSFHVVVIDSNGCTGADTIHIGRALDPELMMQPGDSVATCANVPVVLNALTTGAVAYLWDDNSTQSDRTVTSSGTYTVVGFSSLGCPDTTSAYVLVHPPVSVEISGAPPVLCEGDTVTLSASGNYASWSWSNYETGDAVVLAQSGTYSVTVSDSNQCTASDTVALEFLPLPVVEIGADTAICSGEELVLEAPAGFAIYTWSTGDSAERISVNTPGIYFVEVVDQNGCRNISNLRALSVDTIPLAPTIEKSDILLIAPELPGYSWQWFLEGGAILGAQGVTWSPKASGNYSVEVTDGNGCRSLSNPFFEEVEIREEDAYEIITPNGDGKNENFVIEAVEYHPDNELVIFNRWGSVVYRKQNYQNEFQGLNDNGTPLPDGTYYYVLEFGDGTAPISRFLMITR